MNNQQLAHEWIYAGLEDHGNGSNFSYEGNTLFSYSSVLAVKSEGVIFVSEPIADYSNTSRRHASHMRGAIPSYNRLIYLNQNIDRYINISTMGVGTLKDSFLNPIKELLVKQSKARTRSYFDEINALLEDGMYIIKHSKTMDRRRATYAEFMKLYNADLEKDYKDLIQSHIENEKKAEKREAKKRYENNLKRLENFTGCKMNKYTPVEILEYDFLVIKEEKLCTNRSVCVNLREAQILYKRLEAGKKINGLKIGHYSIVGHNDIFITIGCHKILIKELKRVLNGK